MKRHGRRHAAIVLAAIVGGFFCGFNVNGVLPEASSEPEGREKPTRKTQSFRFSGELLRNTGPVVEEQTAIPEDWDADAVLSASGFRCSAGRGRPWAIVHDADYDLRTLLVTQKWLPHHSHALPTLLSRDWIIVRIRMPGVAPGYRALADADSACAGAPHRCLFLSCDLVDKLPFPWASACSGTACGNDAASHPESMVAATRNAAVLLAASCGASHVLELSSSMLSNPAILDESLLDPTASAWQAGGSPSWRARMAGMGNVKGMAADEPASGGFVHTLAHLGEPVLFPRGLPTARVPNVSMSVLDLRAPMGDLPPAVPIHVLVPDGTPDVAAISRAMRRGAFPRKPLRDYSTRRDKEWLFPGSVTPFGHEMSVRTVNPGSLAPFGAVLTLYSHDALWAMPIFPVCGSAEGIWGAEALRSVIAQAALHLMGATTAFVGGRQGFYRPFAPVTSVELLSEAAADISIERYAAAIVPELRSALLDWPQSGPLGWHEALDVVLSAMDSANALPAGVASGWRRWLADLKRLRYASGLADGVLDAPAPFLTPMTICSNATPASKPRLQRVRAAMCITGEAQYYDSAIASLHTLAPYFPDDNLHVFVYAAAFAMPHDEMLKIMSINATRVVFYGDRITFGRHEEHPEIPRMQRSTDIFAESLPEGFRNHHGMDYQQSWGNNVCYEAVRAWARVHNVEYELFIRQRSDHYTIVSVPQLFPAPLRPGYAIDHLVVPNDQHYMGVNDRWGSEFAAARETRLQLTLTPQPSVSLPVGGFDVMWHHMGRYCKLSQSTVRLVQLVLSSPSFHRVFLFDQVWNPWGEPFLKCSFNESGIEIKFEDALSTVHGGGYDSQWKHCGTLTPDIPALTRSG